MKIPDGFVECMLVANERAKLMTAGVTVMTPLEQRARTWVPLWVGPLLVVNVYHAMPNEETLDDAELHRALVLGTKMPEFCAALLVIEDVGSKAQFCAFVRAQLRAHSALLGGRNGQR